ncbi:uncharacterized protein DMAD_11735 [Drosophila madeirensis]|uniref:Uncharacterized protein n=1 Tax=Drosophila madeirensis TaxID=30013 RepID=A0AAU9FE87_DROMD
MVKEHVNFQSNVFMPEIKLIRSTTLQVFASTILTNRRVAYRCS